MVSSMVKNLIYEINYYNIFNTFNFFYPLSKQSSKTKSKCNIANDKQAKGESNPNERVLLNDVFKLMTQITGENVTLFDIVVTDDGKDPIWVNIGENSKPILLSLVSQGYMSVFGLVGHFMKRLVDVTPIGSDYRQTPAIVLIDEIDTYLHPQWQYKILGFLVQEFPSVQFIVTTHSPYVVGSIPNDKIKIYICEKDGFDAKIEAFDSSNNLYGANIELLTRVLFRSPARVNNFESILYELRKSIQDSNFDKTETLLNDLHKEKLSDTDPELTSIRLLLKTKKRLAGV